MNELLTIGEFAQRCGLSRSALRFYDQNDLLRPRLVDDQTGYRYYALGQLEDAALVRRLRAAEMPVGVLRHYLAASVAQRRELLDDHLAAFHERASMVQDAVGALRRQLEVPARSCTIAPQQFAGGLAQVSFAIADPAQRSDLGAVWIEAKDDSLRLVATDSYRMAVRDLLPERIGSGGLRGVIDAASAAGLATELATAGTLVLHQHPDGAISADVDAGVRTVGHRGERFPDYERILGKVPSGDQIAVPRDVLARALAELPANAPEVRLDFEADRLVLQALDTCHSVTGTWTGAPLTVVLDLRFLTEAVTAMVGPDLVLEAADSLQPLTLRSADTGTFSVLTMPIRPPDQP